MNNFSEIFSIPNSEIYCRKILLSFSIGGLIFSLFSLSSGNILKNYANVFLARFEDSFTQKHLEVDIWHSEYIVGMFFKVLPDDNENKEKIKPPIEKDNNIFLQYISELGIEKISEKLFIQKDIRGFETNSFYIIKPNEKKLWHKAIAYLDVNEFADAMLRAGKKSYNG